LVAAVVPKSPPVGAEDVGVADAPLNMLPPPGAADLFMPNIPLVAG
jgi:hypothetical protein